MKRKFILAGGSGFLGTVLARALTARGDEAVILTRNPTNWCGPGRAVAWDGRSVGAWAKELEGATGLVNLAGFSVNCRHTAANKALILSSRLDSVRVLGEALSTCASLPPVWVQLSGAGYFGNAGEQPCTEETPPGDNFLAQVCVAWEDAFATHCPHNIRAVVLRPGVVLGEQGALVLLKRYTQCFLGAAAGNGRQHLPWLHQDDMIAVILAALTDARFCGTFNVCAPQSRTNAQFMADLRFVLHRPWSPPAPAWSVRLISALMGTHAPLVLEGHHMIPARLAALNFAFKYPTLREALGDLLCPSIPGTEGVSPSLL